MSPFRALGHDRGLYYYLATGAQQVTALTPMAHTRLNLLRLAPLGYWELTYPSKTGASWDQAADAMIRACHEAGIFDPGRIRGRGAWMDGATVVLHLGDQLLIDGRPVPLTSAPPCAIYELGLPIPFDAAAPLSAADAKAFLALCKLPTWQRAVDGYFLAGWCAIAPICGALDWRPHLWVTGGRGSGKSTLYRQIVEPACGDLAVNPMGGSSSAGIRQLLGHDARPVLFDEAEGSSRRSSELMDEILVLMRGASSQTKARIMKGTATGHAQDYRVRSCFGLFSIGFAAVQAADRSRITVLSLVVDRAKSDVDRAEHFRDFQRQVGEILTPAYCARLRARMARLIPQIRASAEVFAATWARVYGDRRVGDQAGAILAGAWACASDQPITEAQAEQFLSSQDWSEEQAQADDRDELACLQHLMQQRVVLDTTRAVRSVGQLLARVSGGDGTIDPKVSVEDATQALRLVGMAYHEDSLAVRIATAHDGTAHLLHGTHWVTSWGLTLRRIPGASWEGRQRFGGAPQRFVAVPILTALGEE